MINNDENTKFTQDGLSNNDINRSIGENCRRCVYADVNGKPARSEICENCVKARNGSFKANVENETEKEVVNPYVNSARNDLKQCNTDVLTSKTNSHNAGDSQNPRPSGLAIASFVLGVVGLIFCCNPLKLFGVIFIPIRFICSLLAIIFASITLKKPPKGFAIAGLVTGIVSMIFFALTIVVLILFGMSFWMAWI